MARIVFTSSWMDVEETAQEVRSALEAAAPPSLITVTPADSNLPIYVNPLNVVMVKTSIGETARGHRKGT